MALFFDGFINRSKSALCGLRPRASGIPRRGGVLMHAALLGIRTPYLERFMKPSE